MLVLKPMHKRNKKLSEHAIKCLYLSRVNLKEFIAVNFEEPHKIGKVLF